MDLRREYHGTSCRRIMALITGLPPEAAVWRKGALPPVEELLVQLLERHDQWARSHLQALLHHKKVAIPPAFHMVRPGEEEQPTRHVETDPAKIAAWFQQNLSEEEVTP